MTESGATFVLHGPTLTDSGRSSGTAWWWTVGRASKTATSFSREERWSWAKNNAVTNRLIPLFRSSVSWPISISGNTMWGPLKFHVCLNPAWIKEEMRFIGLALDVGLKEKSKCSGLPRVCPPDWLYNSLSCFLQIKFAGKPRLLSCYVVCEQLGSMASILNVESQQ